MLIAQIDKENEWNENARMIFKELYEEVPGVKEYVQSDYSGPLRATCPEFESHHSGE